MALAGIVKIVRCLTAPLQPLSHAHGRPTPAVIAMPVTFKVLPPFVEPGFWSLTLYDSANNYTVSNAINRYALGSDDKTLKLNPDGSLTIYLQKHSPGPAKEANWLPAPAGQYYLLLRAYAPGEALLRSRTEPDGLPLPPIDIVQ
jgi:hypothetical protein